MRIAWITAGAGRLYCGACARDLALVKRLRERGHDVQLIPLYTPLRSDGDEPVPAAPVFYGGLSVFLQQRSFLFRHLPDSWNRFLASPGLLAGVSRFSMSTRAQNLGALAVSVLAGRNGRQHRELDRLIEHLEQTGKPEIVHFGNTLLSGIAPEIKSRLNVPIAASLQGENTFVEGMPEPHRSEARRLMRENCRSVDRFLAPCEAHASEMGDLLQIPQTKVAIVRPALDWTPYAAAQPGERIPFTIGWLAAIRPSKGLDILVEAFRRLVNERQLDAVLQVAGQVMDRAHWQAVNWQLREDRLLPRFNFCEEPDRARKIDFLRSCSVFVVTSRFAESRGIAAMEAMACGIPVVAPDNGIFPELFKQTGGGMLYSTGDATALAQQIRKLVDEPQSAQRLGRRAAETIRRDYSLDQAAAGMEMELGRLK
jgi:glycosyltransferase involved in cell wall biosynthesis